MIWTPRTTVAAVIEQDNQFLMVEEEINGRLMLNQPAGHLEHGEGVITAVIRETQEETAWTVKPTALVGIYRWIAPNQTTFMRYCFTADAVAHDAAQILDTDITRALWLSAAEIEVRQADLRSPLVLDCLRDYQAGRRYPLSLLVN